MHVEEFQNTKVINLSSQALNFAATHKAIDINLVRTSLDGRKKKKFEIKKISIWNSSANTWTTAPNAELLLDIFIDVDTKRNT